MGSCLAKDWYCVLVAFSLSIGTVLEDWLQTPLASPSVSMGNMGNYGVWSRVIVLRRAVQIARIGSIK
eukprot:3997955-Prymnesium_polylepis.1